MIVSQHDETSFEGGEEEEEEDDSKKEGVGDEVKGGGEVFLSLSRPFIPIAELLFDVNLSSSIVSSSGTEDSNESTRDSE